MRIRIALLLLAPVLCAGQEFRRHYVTGSVGAGVPFADLRSVTSTSVGAGFSYGYRFHEFFQAEAGYDVLFGAARVRDFLPTAFGNIRIRDYQHFLPFGGRVIVPVASERVHLYAGGGGVYMRYSERVRQPFADSGYRLDCDVCAARDGMGYYGLLGASVALDRAQAFRLGFTTRFIRGQTEGDSIGFLLARKTRDHWVNAAITLGISF